MDVGILCAVGLGMGGVYTLEARIILFTLKSRDVPSLSRLRMTDV